ncbi:MAG: MBL fold metallo-hydrolase [Oscillospiraceae bacterium]|nr:MBL fold metallo-hydrolase [Oscillospiraceae bacterium]
MPNIETLTLGSYQTNCYLVWEAGADRCAVIDPGYDPEAILGKVRSLGLTVDAVLLTHGHFDHVGAVEAIVNATGCPLWMSQSDYTQFKTPINDFFYPIHDCDFAEVSFCEDGEQIRAGNLTFIVLETPGHTPGSVCYLCGDALFSGDTLFAGSCGRTDLPGGDQRAIRRSLRRLADLPGDFKVYPGHADATTLETERRSNPYL